MEIAKSEVSEVKETARQAEESAASELLEMQLALVGGGNGTVIFG